MIPGVGRSPGEGNGNPLRYSCLENSHGQRSLVGYSPWSHKRVRHSCARMHKTRSRDEIGNITASHFKYTQLIWGGVGGLQYWERSRCQHSSSLLSVLMHLIFTQSHEAAMISVSPFCTSGSSRLNSFSKVYQLEGELDSVEFTLHLCPLNRVPRHWGRWNLCLLLNYRWDFPGSFHHPFLFQCVSSAQQRIQNARLKSLGRASETSMKVTDAKQLAPTLNPGNGHLASSHNTLPCSLMNWGVGVES